MTKGDALNMQQRWGTPEQLEAAIKEQFPKFADMDFSEAARLRGMVRDLKAWRDCISRQNA